MSSQANNTPEEVTVADEVWLAVVGHPGYRVSDYGNVESCWSRPPRSETTEVWHPMRGSPIKGYLNVCLRGGVRRPVHQLVLVD